MNPKSAGVLPGTLDLLILKAISLKRLHGYGVLLRIRQISGEALDVPQGSLYPALNRLEHQGLIESEWGREREPAPRQVLPPDPRRTAAVPGRRRRLGTAGRSHAGRPERDPGRGVTCSCGCSRSSPAWIRRERFEDALE